MLESTLALLVLAAAASLLLDLTHDAIKVAGFLAAPKPRTRRLAPIDWTVGAPSSVAEGCARGRDGQATARLVPHRERRRVRSFGGKPLIALAV